MLEGFFNFFGCGAQLAGNRVKTHGSHLVEVFLDHLDGEIHSLALGLAAQLQQDALAQVTRGNTRRIHRLHDVQHIFDLLSIYHIAVVEGHIIGNLGTAAAQVTIVLDVADDGLGYHLLGIVKLQFTQLVM